MIVIGEKINASRKPIAEAISARDAEFIAARVAVEQVEAGAEYLDLNGGDPRFEREAENLTWLIETVQAATDVGISIDTADGAAMAAAVAMAKRKPILNSISLEPGRLATMGPLLADHDCMVVALLVCGSAPQADVSRRLENAEAPIEKITAAGKKLDEIIIDPGLMPLSVDPNAALNALEAIRQIKARWPEVHVVGGVSNVSFGLPERKYVNLALMVQAIGAGMDYGIIDPCADGAMGLMYAAESLAGRDDYCAGYIAAARQHKLI